MAKTSKHQHDVPCPPRVAPRRRGRWVDQYHVGQEVEAAVPMESGPPEWWKGIIVAKRTRTVLVGFGDWPGSLAVGKGAVRPRGGA